MVLLKHSVTGHTYQAPDDDGVVELYAEKGWTVTEAEVNEQDPKYGTYDGDDHTEAAEPAEDAADEDAEPAPDATP